VKRKFRSGLRNGRRKTLHALTAPTLVTVVLQDFRSTSEADISLHRGICRNGPLATFVELFALAIRVEESAP
jgi:hypothetical protein